MIMRLRLRQLIGFPAWYIPGEILTIRRTSRFMAYFANQNWTFQTWETFTVEDRLKVNCGLYKN